MARWIIDPDHSVAAFTVRHMMISNVHGQFNRLSGTIHFDPSNVTVSSVEAAIDVSGVYTGIQKRDDHLRSPDFFDVVEHPRMLFRSSEVRREDGKKLKVAGDLTIRGITRPVTLEVEFSGPVKDPFEEGSQSVGFTASTRINRKDFGVLWNADMEGGMIVGWDVDITLNIEADFVPE